MTSDVAHVVLRELRCGLVVARTAEGYAEQLETLQEVVFPTLADEERFKAAHYRRHVEIFPDGQLVVLDGDHVVGATSTIRYDFDFDHAGHTFAELLDGGWLGSHQPGGTWLYGMDVSVHPDYRGRGAGGALYAARQELVWRLGLRGQLTVGMMSGYGAVRDAMSAEEYFEGLRSGAINDPTLSMQRHVGFEICRLLPGYLQDPVCDGYGLLIVLPAERDVRGAVRPDAGEGDMS